MNSTRRLLDGTLITDHWITVPLDWEDPAGATIDVYAREFTGAEALVKGESYVSSLPYLLFLQGGPGGKGNRPASLSGWMSELSSDFRILMLDQRGTGRSARLDRHTLAQRGGAAAQVDYLRNFRADSIVKDSEALRESLNIDSWTVLGQSYGGFCTLTYLSFASEHLDRALITGGLAPLTGHAQQIYRQTYPLMAARNAEHFARFPEDRRRFDDVAAHLRAHDVRLLDGSPLRVARLQLLGMLLGGRTKADSLHYLLEEAFADSGQTQLSDTFLAAVGQQISFAGNPMYALMHESIYGQPVSGQAGTGWAAETLSDQFPEFSAEAESPLLLGEMIFREHIRLDPALTALYDTAERLAAVKDWPALYDVAQLGRNTVPAAAAVYTDDVFVSKELSLQTASQVNNLQVCEFPDLHHDGIHEDGKRVLRELLSHTS